MVWQQGDRLKYEDFLDRYKLVFLCFAALFLMLSAKLFYLQIIRGEYYTNLSDIQHTTIVIERAPRGDIYDAKGSIVVKNNTTFVVLYYPFVQTKVSAAEIVTQLEKILNKKIEAEVGSGNKVVKLIDKLSRNELFKVEEKRLSIPAISVLEESKRVSIYPEATSHLIGYLSEISPNELEDIEEEGYKAGDLIGRGGLEQQYDLDLRGQDGGWQIEVDAAGRQTKMLKYIPSSKGNNLYTTIDSGLQKASYEALRRSSTGKGAVVIIDPRNGAVKALVSTPGFNPDFSSGKEFARYLKDRNLPLFNRSMQAVYPPGSVFKIVTFISGISENIINPREKFDCTGSFTLGNKKFACNVPSGHGEMSLVPALTVSCNVYFYNAGLKIGQKIMEKYAKLFKIGERTGIDLPSEKKGLLPSQEWKLQKRKMSWLKGDTVNMAIGQGSLLVTPLQTASLVMAVANGGTVYKPFVVEKIVDPDGNIIFVHEPEVREKIELPESTWVLLKRALETVVSNGTARGCAFKEIKVAGKTGTAQNPQGEDHAWFASYAPAENPELAMAVIVENGGSGGHAAVPVARAIYEEYFGLTRQKKETAEVNTANPAEKYRVPVSTVTRIN